MPKVTYIQHDDTAYEADVDTGASLMQGALDNSIPGIDGDCGGECACGTCHVYVEPEWEHKLAAKSAMEESLLSFAAASQPNSRLACQIRMDESLCGIVVRLPFGQH